MTGYLTTHVLDTSLGRPAAEMRVVLFRIAGDTRTRLADVRTNEDGRADGPILPVEEFAPGTYELVFHAGDYLRGSGAHADFMDIIPIRFSMTRHDHYHVPLLLSPYSFGTYRGS